MNGDDDFLFRYFMYFYPDDVDLEDEAFQAAPVEDACFFYSAMNGPRPLIVTPYVVTEPEPYAETWGEGDCYSYNSSKSTYTGDCEHHDVRDKNNPVIKKSKPLTRTLNVKCLGSKNFTILLTSQVFSPAKLSWRVYDLSVNQQKLETASGPGTQVGEPEQAPETYERGTDSDSLVDSKEFSMEELTEFLRTDFGNFLIMAGPIVFIIVTFFFFLHRKRGKGAEDVIETRPEDRLMGTKVLSPEEMEDSGADSEYPSYEAPGKKLSLDQGLQLAKAGLRNNQPVNKIEQGLIDAGFSPQEVTVILKRAKE